MLVKLVGLVLLAGVLTCAAPAWSQIQTREVPVLHAAHPSDPIDSNDARDLAAAEIYAQTFEKLVSAQAWDQAGAIAPLKSAFQASPRLAQRTFTQAWQQWDIKRLGDEWFVDQDGRGMWRGQYSDGRRGLTLGLRQQPDGRWWLVLLRTRSDPGVSPWACSPVCQIVVSTGSRRFPLSARPPLGYDYRSSDVVGAPLPASLLANRSEWIWTIQSPDQSEEPAQFDLSWFPALCRQKLRTCP